MPVARVDDARTPTHVAPDVEAGRGVRQPLASTGTATSRWSTTARLVGIVSMRDLMQHRADPAGRERSRTRSRSGLEGVVVAETEIGDVRGLEGFYHYRQYNAVELARDAIARGRLAPDVRGRAARRGAGARRSSTRCRAVARDPGGGARRAPRDRAPSAGAAPPLDMLRTDRLAARRVRSASSRRSTSTTPSCGTQALRVCAVAPTLLTSISPARSTASSRSTRTPSCAYAANYLYMMQRHGPDGRARPGGRAVPDLDDRPRVQRVDVHGPGDHVDRRRPRRRGRRRDRCAVRPAARRRAEPGARHARRDRHDRQRGAVAAATRSSGVTG